MEVLGSGDKKALLTLTSSDGNSFQIVVGSPNKKRFDSLLKSLHGIDTINTILFENGYDAIIHCSNNLPDVLVLDENLKHISIKDVIRSLRQLDKQHKINIILILNTYDPLKIDELEADSYLFWDILGSHIPEHQHEIIAYTIGRLCGNNDIINYYEDKIITKACLSHFQNTFEWIESVSPSILTGMSNACNHLMNEIGDNDALKATVNNIKDYNIMLRYMLTPLHMVSENQTPVITRLLLNEIVARCVSLLNNNTTSTYHVINAGGFKTVEGDEDLIAGMILQLLMNADQATSGDGEIKITVQNVQDRKTIEFPFENVEYVCVSVQDNGEGISNKYSTKIFEPFFSTKPGFAGKGLTFVRNIVEMHKGLIDVESVPGKGTTVSVYLPVTLENQ